MPPLRRFLRIEITGPEKELTTQIGNVRLIGTEEGGPHKL